MANRSAQELSEAAMEAEEWDRAVQLFSQAIHENPENHLLFGQRAQAFLNMGPHYAMFAAQDAQRSCMMEPSYMNGYLLFSKAQCVSSHFWEAEIGVRKGLLVDPENAALLEQLDLVQQARNDPSTRNPPRFTVIPIYDMPDPYGLVCSHGLIWEGLPELLMVDVPAKKMMLAVELVGTVAKQLQEGSLNLAYGDIIGIEGDRVQALQVSEESNRAAMMNIVGQWNEETEVTILKLLDEDNPPEPKERETSIPPAPDGNETLLQSILNKWRDVADSGFTFLIDGNQENENEYNRMAVPLSFLMKKKTTQYNWDAAFTRQEGQYTWSNWDAVKHHARADLLGVGYALDCRYIQNIVHHATSPDMVQSRYLQGVKLATDD